MGDPNDECPYRALDSHEAKQKFENRSENIYMKRKQQVKIGETKH